MNILALDSSSTSGSIALMKNNKLTYMSFLDIKRTHSERLLPQIDFGLKQSNLQVANLDLLVLANGPGSFTGLRIGLATIKGLSLANEIPILPVNTLYMLAKNVQGTNRAIMSFIDAKMNEIYAALYTPDFKEIIAPCNSEPENFLKKINRPIIAVGNATLKYQNLMSKLNLDYKIAPLQQNFHNSVCLLAIAKEQKFPKYDLDKISSLEPYYLRRSQAEIVKEKKEKEAKK
ncbi:MAG: tRNA (adenosine(37)-N6)-threonylcarbamoyltransferase complex dimerization subunit type 1 TsaB [Candidatus Cloacimonadota bacterium]|nr:tRNA (adenosine(37)-N6)-threonylcarbamoyltransferase complex dimerization subunit type 1 TsaB [Candidatus Cloacimonadota bacterium]